MEQVAQAACIQSITALACSQLIRFLKMKGANQTS